MIIMYVTKEINIPSILLYIQPARTHADNALETAKTLKANYSATRRRFILPHIFKLISVPSLFASISKVTPITVETSIYRNAAHNGDSWICGSQCAPLLLLNGKLVLVQASGNSSE